MHNSTDTSKTNSQNNDFYLTKSLKEKLLNYQEAKEILENIKKNLTNDPTKMQKLEEALHEVLENSHKNIKICDDNIKENDEDKNEYQAIKDSSENDIRVTKISLELLQIPQSEWDSKIEEYQQNIARAQAMLEVLENDSALQTTSTTSTLPMDDSDEESDQSSVQKSINPFDSDTIHHHSAEDTIANQMTTSTTSASQPNYPDEELNQNSPADSQHIAIQEATHTTTGSSWCTGATKLFALMVSIIGTYQNKHQGGPFGGPNDGTF